MSKLGSARFFLSRRIVLKAICLLAPTMNLISNHRHCSTKFGHWILDIDYWILNLMFYKIV